MIELTGGFHLPKLLADLVATLASLQVDDFPHLELSPEKVNFEHNATCLFE